MAQSNSPVAALASLEVGIKFGRWGFVLLNLCTNGCLWLIFYLISQWLGEQLQQQAANPFPATAFITLSLGFLLCSWSALGLRQRLGKHVQQNFYQRFFGQLLYHRWALIRSKPITAWQDVSFRHLPAMESYLLDYRAQQVLIAIVPLLVLAIVLPISWLAALILFITLPLMPIFMWLVGAGTASAQKKHMTALNRLGLFFADRIRGASTVRILHQQQSQLAAFQRASQAHNERLAEVLRLAFLNTSVLDFFATVSIALQAVFIGFALLGEVAFGFYGQQPALADGLFILLLSPAFFAELKKLGKLYHVKAEAVASAELWQTTLRASNTSLDDQASGDKQFQSLTIDQGDILGFDNVPLVHIRQCTLTAHDRVLLTGESGSGKSVVLDTIAGLRTISHSQMTLNRQQTATLIDLREQICYLGQTPIFLDGNIAENIGLGQYTERQIAQAIAAVGMADWLATLPQGLATPLHEQTILSGGQKRKLALARIQLFNAAIVLLDEPLAHLSAAEQADLLPVLERLTRGRCSIWVSHIPLSAVPFTKEWRLADQQLTEVGQ